MWAAFCRIALGHDEHVGNMAALWPVVIGYILNGHNGNWNLTFYLSAAIYLMGIVCWKFLDPVTPLEAVGWRISVRLWDWVRLA